MKDPYQEMLEECLALSIVVIGFVLFLALQGCTQHKVDVTSSSVDNVVDRIAALNAPVKCKAVNLGPVPEQVHLSIEGDKISSDPGGEQLLRGYISCRSLYQAAR